MNDGLPEVEIVVVLAAGSALTTSFSTTEVLVASFVSPE